MEAQEDGRERLTDDDYQLVRDIVAARAGIILSGERHRSMVQGRLGRRVRALGMEGFGQYCRMLKTGENEAEFEHFINAITTNVTSFFREGHHFEHFRTYLQELVQRPDIQAARRIRIWSAAASSGEEPYSIAMTVLDALEQQKSQGWDIKVLATDLDTSILEKARAGKYPDDARKSLYGDYEKRFTQNATEEGFFEIKQKVKDILFFKHLNLLHAWRMKGPFDAIFCRNVFIYFSPETQQEIASRFAKLLRPNAMLYIGHSENLFGLENVYKNSGKTTYLRVDNAT